MRLAFNKSETEMTQTWFSELLTLWVDNLKPLSSVAVLISLISVILTRIPFVGPVLSNLTFFVLILGYYSIIDRIYAKQGWRTNQLTLFLNSDFLLKKYPLVLLFHGGIILLSQIISFFLFFDFTASLWQLAYLVYISLFYFLFCPMLVFKQWPIETSIEKLKSALKEHIRPILLSYFIVFLISLFIYGIVFFIFAVKENYYWLASSAAQTVAGMLTIPIFICLSYLIHQRLFPSPQGHSPLKKERLVNDEPKKKVKIY